MLDILRKDDPSQWQTQTKGSDPTRGGTSLGSCSKAQAKFLARSTEAKGLWFNEPNFHMNSKEAQA